MNDIFGWFQKNIASIYKYFLFLVAVLIIVQLFPRLPRFGYDYQQGRPWSYVDLIAPFDFAILKSKDELEAEKAMVMKEFRSFFFLDQEVAAERIELFETNYLALNDSLGRMGLNRPTINKNLATGKGILDSIFKRGVIFLGDEFLDKPPEFEIRLIVGQVAQRKMVTDFLTISQAYLQVRQLLERAGLSDQKILRTSLENALDHNVFYDEELTTLALESELNDIALSRGMIQQGEKIISRGELINAEKFQILESYKAEYQKITGRTSSLYLLVAGQILLVGISMVVLVLFLYVFRRDVYANNRRILLILLTVIFMVSVTSLVIRFNVDFLFLLPVCIVPVVIRAFFDNRLALYVHINTIILIGFLIPRSFEFVFLQFIAGIIAILSMVSLRRRSQLFFTVLLIFLTYAAVYLGLSLAHGGTFADLRLTDYLYFAGGALLTLFAYPLIFLLERLFGLPTDFSLLELSDTNNHVLRKLSMLAPGTFQHSLQVSNLAEEAIYAIGGNALLTRTGALYHDIGKLENPYYFTENQALGVNPHDELTNKESAAIIIDHVIKGIEMARRNNLPEYIIDFIRTHHGTTTARYFYTMHVRENPGQGPDKEDFVYPGPKPFSRETAVVMMADSVEAASRSLAKPNEDQINQLVDKICGVQMEDNQFENAPITFKDFETVKRIFKRRLLNIYHVRVAYPAMS
jgi:cyclic-di-AMP phosphodiesterase PgpH